MKKKEQQQPTISSKIKSSLKVLGPGLITGASDDDPSGIATYSQAGASLGFTTLWTAILTFPLMAAVQGMCARIGLVTQAGLTSTLKKHYPKSILYLMMVFSFPAITLNIGADLQGMGAVANLLVPRVPVAVFSIVFTLLLMFIVIKYSYTKITLVLKWLCLSLFLYFIVPFIAKVDWGTVAKATFIPAVHFNKVYLEMFVALLGTTISPYLFFWQTTMEAEDMQHDAAKVMVNKQILSDMRKDVNFGMLFSNIVMFFIIVTAGAVLFNGGIHKIDTVEQAAKALEPLAGKFAYLLFAMGVIGTGMLTIPVLGGALSYIVAETFDWKEGLDKKFYEAKSFYLTLVVSLLLGLSLNFIGITPIQALIYTAVLYGLTAPVMIAVILHICNNKTIMGNYTNNTFQNMLGFITLLIMTAAAVALIYFLFQ